MATRSFLLSEDFTAGREILLKGAAFPDSVEESRRPAPIVPRRPPREGGPRVWGARFFALGALVVLLVILVLQIRGVG